MANCAYHPERDVVGACVDCGKLVCAECKTTLGGKIYCNPCVDKEYSGVTKGTSDQGRLAVIPKKARGRNYSWQKQVLIFLGFLIVLAAVIIIIAAPEDGSTPTPTQPSTQPSPTSPVPAPAPLVPLGRVQISPEAITLTPGGVQQFSASAFDKNNNEIKDFTSKWTVAEGGGRIYENGIFVAGTEAGTYKDTVTLEATYDGVSEVVVASVTVTVLPSGQTLIFTPKIPAYVPGMGYLIYEDDFSSNLGWVEKSKDGKEYYLKDGAYHMIVPSGFNSAWASGASLSQLGDFSLEVTLSRISGPQDNKYGITFEIGDTGQRGYILINNEGQVYFWKNEGEGTYINSIKVFEGPITTSPGESLDKVKLGVKRQGANWKVSVNDSPAISVSDTAEPITRVGFMVGENLHATFDNLKVYSKALPRAPPSAPSGFTVFSDTFDNWNLREGYFQEGALHLVTANEKYASSVNERIPKINSFAYQAELYFKEALPQTQGRLNLQKEQGEIYFAISPTTRQFEISYYNPEEGYDWLIGKTFSGAIKGQGEVNKLLVIGRDSSLEFYVNDLFLGNFADPYPDSPLTKIELYVKGESSHVTFDNVALHSLSPLPVVILDPPQLSSELLVFSDNFDGGWNQGWSLIYEDYFQEGALHQITTNEQTYSSSVNERIPKISSFAYQAELYFKEALPQTQGRLVLQKEQGKIYFAISPTTRQFEISYYNPEEGFDWLIRDIYFGAIKGQGEVNKLLVIGRDSSLEVYVNDVFLGSFADPYPDSPLTKIGLYVKGEGSHVTFDNVALHSLAPLPAAIVEPSAELPQVESDIIVTKRVFTVFAFLNAVGFNDGIEYFGFTPMRVRVREALAELDPALLQQMKDHYEENSSDSWLTYGLSITGEGPFRETSRTYTELRGTASLLNEFYTKGNLNQLWQEVEPEYLAHMETVLPQVEEAGGDVSAYLRQPFPPGTFYYVPNWLDKYQEGSSWSSDSELFIALTPQSDTRKFVETSRHEFLHVALDNFLEENAAAIKAKEYLFQQVPQEVIDLGYDTWSYFVEESLVRAITIRMASIYEPAWPADQDEEDYFLIEPFLEALKDFEASSGTFDQNIPTILQAIP